jgi:predicted nuclease of predicted toxin-antitoxin system
LRERATFMKILFDQGTPAPLRRALREHAVMTAHEKGWGELDNGKLLAAAEVEFDVLVTTDRSLRFQQRLAGRPLAILVLPTMSWPELQRREAQIAATIDGLRPGDVVEMPI